MSALPRSFRHIQVLAKQHANTITLGQLMRSTRSDTVSLIRQGQWLRGQLPIRFARRLDEFLQLPYVVVHNKHIKQVLDIYVETFESVSDFPSILTEKDEAEFAHLVRAQLEKHQAVARLIAEGYREVRMAYPHFRLDTFLDRLFITRISVRILMENYIRMRSPQEGFIGVVQKEMSPHRIIQELSNEITRLTEAIYGVAPEIEFRGNVSCTLDYIPRHVQFMCQELLKNAVRATTERHKPRDRRSVGFASEPAMPKVVVELQKGDVHVIIKISDQGGGVPKRVQDEAWQYGWTTADNDHEDEEDPYSGCTWRKELAGYGFGLPLTRLHAQYFGGDVFMQALPGHGTDMYLLLNHLKEGSPSTEEDDPSTALTVTENQSVNAP
ncbi:Bckdk [Symbiodinium natans]|uniref:Protein-serine/threonine kinase n=1 Tax=Symbiodinium natans TaxID=878477 RepID=A0A812GW27_9DINO|nr:Bckdk [Symbiodinium natans]